MVRQQYKDHDIGLKLKNELLDIIHRENIGIEKSLENALNYTAGIKINWDDKWNIVSKTIVLPRFTEADILTQAVVISHELGHYYAYEGLPGWHIKMLNADNEYSRFYNEILAWEKAEILLNELGYWENETVRLAFKESKDYGLGWYKPGSTSVSNHYKKVTHGKNVFNYVEDNINKLLVYWLLIVMALYTFTSLIYPNAESPKILILLSLFGVPITVFTLLLIRRIFRYARNIIRHVRSNGYDKTVKRQITIILTVLMICNIAFIFYINSSWSTLNIFALVIAAIAFVGSIYNIIDDIRTIGWNNYINEILYFR